MQRNAAAAPDTLALASAAISGHAAWRMAAVPVLLVANLYGVGHVAHHALSPRIEDAMMQAFLDYTLSVVPLLIVVAYCLHQPMGASLFNTLALGRPTDPDHSIRRSVMWSSLAIVLVGACAILFLLATPWQPALELGQLAQSFTPTWWLLAPSIVLVAPLCEEIVFRGYLYDRVERALGGATGPVIVTGVAFAALHLPATPIKAMTLVSMGMVLGALRARCGSVWPGIALHAVWNGVMLLCVTVAATVLSA